MKREELIAKGYTEEQVNQLLDMFHSENNETKANNAKLQEELKKAQSQLSEYSEWKKSQMSEQEKLNAMIAETEAHLKKSKLIESKANAKTIFAEIGGIDDNILDSIVTEDFEQTKSSAEALVNMIRARDEMMAKKTKEALLNAKVLPSIDNNSVANGDKSNSMTKEEFNKLTIAEKSKIFKENKELWDKMTQQ